MIGNSVTVPVGVMRPILLLVLSTNQRFPSAPVVMVSRPSDDAGRVDHANSRIVPSSSTRPIMPVLASVNQMFPSAPKVRKAGEEPAVGTVNSSTYPHG